MPVGGHLPKKSIYKRTESCQNYRAWTGRAFDGHEIDLQGNTDTAWGRQQRIVGCNCSAHVHKRRPWHPEPDTEDVVTAAVQAGVGTWRDLPSCDDSADEPQKIKLNHESPPSDDFAGLVRDVERRKAEAHYFVSQSCERGLPVVMVEKRPDSESAFARWVPTPAAKLKNTTLWARFVAHVERQVPISSREAKQFRLRLFPKRLGWRLSRTTAGVLTLEKREPDFVWVRPVRKDERPRKTAQKRQRGEWSTGKWTQPYRRDKVDLTELVRRGYDGEPFDSDRIPSLYATDTDDEGREFSLRRARSPKVAA